MEIVHIMPIEKFTQPYIQFINENFDKDKHFFILYGDFNGVSNLPQNTLIVNKSISFLLMLERLLHSAKQVILHSLFISETLLVFFRVHSYILKKCYWTVWGADLYFHLYKQNSFKDKLREGIYRSIIPRLGGVITHVQGDYELAKKWYGAKGGYHYCFMYLSNAFNTEFYDYNTSVKEDDQSTTILIGNSADPSNNHLEILQKLENLKDASIKLVCPLSYGSRSYANKVIETGNNMFGEKFVPLLEFFSLETYNKVLRKVDVAIFNHQRQQGLGNIINLLGLGKKVFIRGDITTWDFAVDHELIVYNTSELTKENILSKIPDDVRNNNQSKIKSKFSLDKLNKDWEKIFNAQD